MTSNWFSSAQNVQMACRRRSSLLWRSVTNLLVSRSSWTAGSAGKVLAPWKKKYTNKLKKKKNSGNATNPDTHKYKIYLVPGIYHTSYMYRWQKVFHLPQTNPGCPKNIYFWNDTCNFDRPLQRRWKERCCNKPQLVPYPLPGDANPSQRFACFYKGTYICVVY